MKRGLYLSALPVAAALAFTYCGGGGGAKSKTDLKNATSLEPSGTLTSTSQINSAVEGLFSGSLSAAITNVLGGNPKLNPNVTWALEALRETWKTHAATGSSCSSVTEKSISIDYGCAGVGSGSVDLSCDGNFEAGTDIYCEFVFHGVSVPDLYSADGVISYYIASASDVCVGAQGTFNEQTIKNNFIACVNPQTGNPTLLAVEDDAGDVFIIDNILCDPSFDAATSCTFDVTDATKTVGCTATPTSSDTWTATCTGLSS